MSSNLLKCECHIHSFITDISTAHLKVHFTTQRRSRRSTGRLCRIFTPKRHRQLCVKDLYKISMWQLKRIGADSGGVSSRGGGNTAVVRVVVVAVIIVLIY